VRDAHAKVVVHLTREEPEKSPRRTREEPDVNIAVAGWLSDLARAQTSRQRQWGYKQAAAAIRSLDEPIDALVQPDGSLRKVPHIGPASTRVILEVLHTGRSETVDRALLDSPNRADVERRRPWRRAFLSRARVRAVLEATAGPGLVDVAGYRGDLQTHSTWSDGVQTLEELVDAALHRGYAWSAITDHSAGLPIAGGLSNERLAAQREEVDRLNARYAGRFRLLAGVEANIRADGEVDVDADTRRRLDVVVAAPHSALRLSQAQTERMIAAVRTPGVHILGHPRGRMYGSRPGVSADWPLVFAAAAEHDVAIEIDGDPARQDVDFELAQSAMDAGCLFALDSDAHAAGQLRYAETALAHARIAGVPAERIVNTWPLERLLEWLRRD
jgi:putative hydrolase